MTKKKKTEAEVESTAEIMGWNELAPSTPDNQVTMSNAETKEASA